MPPVHKTTWCAALRALVSALVALHMSCFNSDDLLYALCDPEPEEDCTPAGSEPKASITQRACFVPRGDRPGYCAPRCAPETPCEVSVAPLAVTGSYSSVECLPMTDDYSVCKLTCLFSQDCPSSMTCEALDGEGFCIPR